MKKVKKKRWRVFRRICAVLALLFVWYLVLYWWPDSKIIVSRETTYVTDHVDEEGYVDYVAAINARASEGITPQNNAAVLFLEAAGPGDIDPEVRKEFVHLLGMEELPEVGDYFLDLEEFLVEEYEEETNDRFGGSLELSDYCHDLKTKLTQTPWTAEEYPQVAHWLKANEGPLEAFIAGAKRSHRYVPLVAPPRSGDEKQPVPAVLEGETVGVAPVGLVVDASKALLMRSMLHCGSGDHEDSVQDLADTLSLMGQSENPPAVVDALMATAYASQAINTMAQNFHESDVSEDNLRRLKMKFEQIDPRRIMLAAADWRERLTELDLLQATARFSERIGAHRVRGGIDSNEIMRACNERIDLEIQFLSGAAADDPELAARFDEIDVEVWARRAKDKWSLWRYPFSRDVRTKHWRDTLITLIMPSYMYSGHLWSTEPELRRTQMDTLIALTLYRQKQGEYPSELAGLVPEFLDAVSIDPWDQQPMRYRRQDGGYILYSIGRDAKDDGGAIDPEEGWRSKDDVIIVPARLEPEGMPAE